MSKPTPVLTCHRAFHSVEKDEQIKTHIGRYEKDHDDETRTNIFKQHKKLKVKNNLESIGKCRTENKRIEQ